MSFVPARLAAASCIVASSLVYAGEPVRLNKEETQQALSGKSITYESRGSTVGSTIIFFAAEGRMTMKVTNSPRVSSGTWSVDDEGRYCIKIISGTGTEGCRHLLKTDTGYAIRTGRGDIEPTEAVGVGEAAARRRDRAIEGQVGGELEQIALLSAMAVQQHE